MAWIRTVKPEEAGGPLKEEYDRAVERSGGVAEVLQLSSLHPTVLRHWVQLYETVLLGPSPLTRAERELIATVVSLENDCHY